MSYAFEPREDGLRVVLTGWDRAATLRREVLVPTNTIVGATKATRGSLERLIDHRVIGFGTHDGAKRPGRRRVGSMMGRGVAGRQFWAVPASTADLPVLVLRLRDHEFRRAVLAVEDPDAMAEHLTSRSSHP